METPITRQHHYRTPAAKPTASRPSAQRLPEKTVSSPTAHAQPKEKRTLSFQEFTRGLSSHFPLRGSVRRLRHHGAGAGDRPLALAKALAVSDGELNVISPGGRSSGGCSGSNSSLPSVPAEGGGGVGQVASWAVSFERLLEDPMGVHYFTAFLKSEVSVENILFWLACEKFRKIPADHTEQLCERALAIYEAFLSCTATHPVNIDDKGRVEEASLRTPHPGMFQQAQQQIFKLMKFDSYSRFVRSQLYQSCMLANVEGRSLPELSSRPKAPPAPPAPKVGPDAKERSKVRSGRPGGTELEEVERRKALLQGIIGWDKRKEKRGSWGESVGPGRAGGGRTAAEVDQVPQSDPGGSRAGRTRADKYCCVYLPDGTASLTPARPGVTVRSMLTGLCEKRGLPLSDIIIYLQGKDKQPLSMDQDSAVLKDQQVFLELRVTFAVEVAFTGRMVGMMVKSHKTLQDALATLLQKHRMRPQDAVVTMSGSGEALSMSTVATSLANKTLILNRLKDVEQAGGSRAAGPQGRRGAVDLDGWSTPQYRANVKLRNPGARRAYDMEAGLVELLNRAQGCSADDQRGLLRKEHLMLPQFLQHPPEGAVEEDEGGRERRERFADTRAEARSDMAAVDSGPASLLPPFLPLEGAERSGSTAGDPGRETAV